MLKGIGLILIFLTGSGSGCFLSATLRQRITRLEAIRSMLLAMHTEMRYRAPTLRELLTQLAGQPTYQSLDFLQTAAKQHLLSFPDAWCYGIAQDTRLDAEERTLLSEIGMVLGTTDLEGQLTAISLHSERLTRLTDAAREGYEKKGTLFRSLGVLGGAFAAILLA